LILVIGGRSKIGAAHQHGGHGLTDWFATALVGLYQDYRRSGTDGYAAQVTGTVQRRTGRPARSLDDLLSETAVPGPNGGPNPPVTS
jgi:hypothetical protein